MMTAIEDRYAELHPTSLTLAGEAAGLFPQGVTHASRFMSPFPVYMERGSGPRKWDVDGNEYIDYKTGHGSMILGQANPAIVNAVQTQMTRGTHLSSGTRLEIEWANAVRRLVPAVEKVRFVSSGTEALMMAFKMARVYSGKEKIVKFAGAFHGWSDPAFVTDPETDRRDGIPRGTSDTIINAPPHDLEALDELLQGRDDVAAVVFQGNDIARPEFITGLREVTEQHDTLLIFDEVVSGFRWSNAGCQGRFGVEPDISAFAKILAGGLPGGCVGGRAEVVDTVGGDGIRHPGTFNANPLSAAAGCTALKIVESEPVVETAEKQAARLRDGINNVLQTMEIPGGAYGVASIVMVSLGSPVDTSDPYAVPVGAEQGGRPVTNDVLDQLELAIVNEGLWTHPASMILSATHSDDDIDQTVDRFGAGLRTVRAAGLI
jgi:glutamate-1-semialdehyde 2,1-aminomutase